MSEHRLFPHSLPESLTPGIWQVKGALPFPLPRYMTIVRLKDGRLLIYNAIAMNDAGMKALDALGDVAFMVVPTPFHIMDAPFYKKRYPKLTVIAAPDAQARLGAEVPVDGTPQALLPPLGVRVHITRGLKFHEVVIDTEANGGRGLFFTDLFLNNAANRPLILRILGAPGQLGVPRIVKWRQVKDKQATREFLSEMAALDDVQVLSGSHGPPVTSNCRGALEEAARTL